MAIGLCLAFNMRLPVNFDSPYNSLSVIDFWRRWHITLSSFLKRYLYIPLGGNRRGELAKTRNLMITMLLGGLWHGAGWTFVIWGGLHGAYLVINNLWRKMKFIALPRPLAWFATFLPVALAWVFFRADSAGDAISLIERMFDFGGVSPFAALSPGSYPLLRYLPRIMIFAAAAFALVLAVCPANIQRMTRYDPANPSGDKPAASCPGAVAFLFGVLFFLSVKELFAAAPSEFLYFNF